MRILLACLAVAALPMPTSAQRLLSHDTLTMDSPTAITCGFCSGESYGTIFRELPAPARGLEPGDFPVVVESLQVAVASARAVSSTMCVGSISGGTGVGDVEIYAGTTPPTGDIVANPADGPWDGETLVWAATNVPFQRSTAETEGSAAYEVMFNNLEIVDAEEMPVRVEAPNVYLRAVVHFGDGAAGDSVPCEDLSLTPPSFFPLRDNDGRIAPERSFIYADGLGWVWNEDARVGSINGDWAIRLEITTEGVPGTDAGPAVDAGPRRDAGLVDAGAADGGGGTDAGEPGGGGGGGCAAAGRAQPAPWALLLAPLLALGMRRRR